MNDKAYAPQFISIGPFHHRTRNDLIANEHYKLQEPINMNEEEFVLMMLVDACFILEFFILLIDDHYGAHWLKKNNDSFGVPSLCCFSNKEAETREKDSENYFRLSPPSITELCEAGVTIKAAKREDLCFMNIGFKNGVLEIPCIDIDCTFEVVIRNVIAFDQYPAGNEKMYAIHYVLFLDDLINTEQDAHLLTKAGIIINTFGGSDKDITEMFNRFSKFVTFPICSHFDDINKALRMHCNGRWNMAKASLKHNYFNTPWAIISFGAATFLIILTILQTIFSAISTFRN
ncbi:UPF0481 protein [Cucumis melo var. makuwa]|uniref:UPF0481 protein n=1 Tax=Cucumis melo var. makuwa TaxID=1194695 RepID=A0A5A7VD43_CUCMM|nr:UPF0481 protein [Cucumis melo var. makuwa]